MTSPAVEFYLAIRSEVAIEATPGTIWGCLDRPQDWKPSIVAVEHLGGTRGGEGERLRVAQRPGEQTVQVLMETVRLDPHVWRVQTLTTEASNSTDGYVIYSLRPAGATVQLTCEVVARCSVPAAAIGDATVADFSARINEATRDKVAADLLALKTLAERPA